MKVFCLNIWGGKLHEPLLKLIEDHAPTTDVFCFQEVFSSSLSTKIIDGKYVSIFETLQVLLSRHGFRGSFAPATATSIVGNKTLPISYGNALFYRHVPVKQGYFHVFSALQPWRKELVARLPKVAQYIQIKGSYQNLTLVNFHGFWAPGLGKEDMPIRIRQSKKISKFLTQQSGLKVLCGDFNILPSTKSMDILERGMQNPLIERGVMGTRSELYKGEQRFADYVLLSDSLKVTNFSVLEEIVSDHLAIVVEFDYDIS